MGWSYGDMRKRAGGGGEAAAAMADVADVVLAGLFPSGRSPEFDDWTFWEEWMRGKEPEALLIARHAVLDDPEARALGGGFWLDEALAWSDLCVGAMAAGADGSGSDADDAGAVSGNVHVLAAGLLLAARELGADGEPPPFSGPGPLRERILLVRRNEGERGEALARLDSGERPFPFARAAALRWENGAAAAAASPFPSGTPEGDAGWRYGDLRKRAEGGSAAASALADAADIVLATVWRSETARDSWPFMDAWGRTAEDSVLRAARRLAGNAAARAAGGEAMHDRALLEAVRCAGLVAARASGRAAAAAGEATAAHMRAAAMLLAARELGADPGPLPYSGPGSIDERLARIGRESR